jgi:hypothetical protein
MGKRLFRQEDSNRLLAETLQRRREFSEHNRRMCQMLEREWRRQYALHERMEIDWLSKAQEAARKMSR